MPPPELDASPERGGGGVPIAFHTPLEEED